MTGVVLNDVAKSFGAVDVLRNINLEIKPGEFVVFVGPSGCGKSTLLRMIAGLASISSGDMFIDGMRVNDIPPAQRGIAMVFQSYALYPHMTVRENMAFALKIARKTPAEINEAIEAAAKVLQIDEYLDRLPKALSGGQRQRVAIGRAIVRDPKVFLFDEPLSNLDAALRVATRLEFARLKETMPDKTMIYVTHDQVEAMTLADRIVVLADKGISQVGTPLELYNTPANRFVAQFIGSPPMNMFPAQITQTGASTEAKLLHGNSVVKAVSSEEAMQGSEITVGVRPEHLVIGGEAPIIEGQVEYTEALGEYSLVHITTTSGKIIAKETGNGVARKGDHVALGADPQDVHFFSDQRMS